MRNFVFFILKTNELQGRTLLAFAPKESDITHVIGDGSLGLIGEEKLFGKLTSRSDSAGLAECQGKEKGRKLEHDSF